KAKLGHRGLTIIGQGQSDLFVRISPEERRVMIEEILGLKEFRLKKKTAERRLNRSITNSEKLEAKIEEIKPHLRFLKKQKNKWDKRSNIEHSLKELSETYFSYHYNKFVKNIKDFDNQINSLTKQIEEKESVIKELSSKVSQINQDEGVLKSVNKLRNKINDIEDERFKLERKLTELEVRKEFTPKKEDKKGDYSSSYLLNLIESFLREIKAKIDEDPNQLKDSISTWISKFEDLFDKKEEVSNDSEDDKISAQNDKQINKVKDEIDDLNSKIKELRKEEESVLSSQEDKNKLFRNQVEKLEEKKNESRELDHKVNKLILEKEKSVFRKKELENKWTSLGFPLNLLANLELVSDDIVEDKNWDKVENIIDKLRSELNAIGDIDKSMIAEANETEERYNFLSKELEDLKKASDDLKKLIDDLERRIHKDFKKDFTLVNKEFNNYFRLMFGGGKSRLKLSIKKDKGNEDSEEIIDNIESGDEELKAGVDIELKLPGKKINSLDMLSGGEKTLVSLAALFALISVSPPPFLVLDEIDAALDESNTARFAELIKEFSHKTQFIMVTHNRVTMESVDSLYGVTMGDDGVSKVLSLKFEEADELAQ
ncbi:MAG: hypothetical protein WD095_00880, partial [Candidatus Paceibacterota bacterium]